MQTHTRMPPRHYLLKIFPSPPPAFNTARCFFVASAIHAPIWGVPPPANGFAAAPPPLLLLLPLPRRRCCRAHPSSPPAARPAVLRRPCNVQPPQAALAFRVPALGRVPASGRLGLAGPRHHQLWLA